MEKKKKKEKVWGQTDRNMCCQPPKGKRLKTWQDLSRRDNWATDTGSVVAGGKGRAGVEEAAQQGFGGLREQEAKSFGLHGVRWFNVDRKAQHSVAL